MDGHVDDVDQYGNPMDVSSLPFCCFPDCGCDGARLCMADSGANNASAALNLERRRAAKRNMFASTLTVTGTYGRKNDRG